MKKDSMNCKRSKHSIMLIMLGIALSVILLLSPSLGFASDIHRWDFDYDSIRDTHLYDSVGGWWDKRTYTAHNEYITWIEDLIAPIVTSFPWFGLKRVDNTGGLDSGAHAYIYTLNSDGVTYDNPVEGDFQYSAYFRVNSLPSESSCFMINEDTCGGPNGETVWEGCSQYTPVDNCCIGKVENRNNANSHNAWYVVVEAGGEPAIGGGSVATPIYVAYDNTIRGFFTSAKDLATCGNENLYKHEVIAKIDGVGEDYHVMEDNWYFVRFTVERVGTGADEKIEVSRFISNIPPRMDMGSFADPRRPRWVKEAWGEKSGDDRIPNVPIKPGLDAEHWHITIGANSGGHSYYFDGIIDSVQVITNMSSGGGMM